ncbi:MAG: four helix bundle protein [bacterium]
MKIEKFEDLIAWQKAKELTTKLYVVCKNCKEYGLKDIMTKTGIGMMNQIAEGFEKRNNKDIKAAFLTAK